MITPRSPFASGSFRLMRSAHRRATSKRGHQVQVDHAPELVERVRALLRERAPGDAAAGRVHADVQRAERVAAASSARLAAGEVADVERMERVPAPIAAADLLALAVGRSRIATLRALEPASPPWRAPCPTHPRRPPPLFPHLHLVALPLRWSCVRSRTLVDSNSRCFMLVDAVDLPLRCDCGAWRGVLRSVEPGRGNRCVCYCDDCQSFAYSPGPCRFDSRRPRRHGHLPDVARTAGDHRGSRALRVHAAAAAIARRALVRELLPHTDREHARRAAHALRGRDPQLPRPSHDRPLRGRAARPDPRKRLPPLCARRARAAPEEARRSPHPSHGRDHRGRATSARAEALAVLPCGWGAEGDAARAECGGAAGGRSGARGSGGRLTASNESAGCPAHRL